MGATFPRLILSKTDLAALLGATHATPHSVLGMHPLTHKRSHGVVVRALVRDAVSCEVIDVQTLLPFDIHHSIVQSVMKTNRVVFADEDVPGGASSFMMQKVIEEQGAYQYLDAKPMTITAKEHRPAYGSDGDYFSKPNPEEIVDKIYALMREGEPERFPSIY